MVQLKSRKDGGFELTDRDRVVTMSGKDVQLEDETFSEPGEYEVEGIEVVYGNQAALLVWEKLQIVYVFSGEKPGAFEKAQFSPCNVVLVSPAIEKLDKPSITELLETYDPGVVAFGASSDLKEIQDALKIEDRDLLKLSENTLPVEGRELYRLTA